jgi:hypothetical protein
MNKELNHRTSHSIQSGQMVCLSKAAMQRVKNTWKMLNVINHQGNANQNYNETFSPPL